jgi:peptidoglycan/LPS O-acetylase OafA/YrhL
VLAFVLCPLLRVAALLFSGNTVAATFLLPMRADALFAGVLGAVIVRHEPAVQLLRRHRSLLGAALLVLAAFLAVLTTRSLSAGAPLMISVGYTVAAVFFAGSVLWVVLFPASLAARLCRFEPLCAIGVVSYFVYLAHTPVFFVTHWLARGQPPLHLDWTGAALTVLALGLTAALAALSWRWLETPLLRLGRRFTYS